jgi:hypothetical protein
MQSDASESESEPDDSGSDTVDDTESGTEDGENTDSGAEEEDEGPDEDPWESWVEDIFETYQEPMKDRAEELEDNSDTAHHDTFTEYLPRMNKALQKQVITFSILHHRLKNDTTYQKIMETAKRVREEDEMDFEESVTHAVKRRKLLLDRVLERWTPDLDEDEDSD